MSLKLLTKYHLEFLSLKGGCTGSSESTHAKMPHCWKSHVKAHLVVNEINKKKTWAAREDSDQTGLQYALI